MEGTLSEVAEDEVAIFYLVVFEEKMSSREYAVFQCFQCSAFAINQITKNRKWKCKLCGSQQSIRKIYATSAQPKDLRPIVQNLNMKRGEIEQELNNQEVVEEEPKKVTVPSQSKWTKYNTKQEESESEEDGIQIVTSMETNKKTRRSAPKPADDEKKKRAAPKKRSKEEFNEEHSEYQYHDEYQQDEDFRPSSSFALQEEDEFEAPTKKNKPTNPVYQPKTNSKWNKYL